MDIKCLLVNPKERMACWPKTNNGGENVYWYSQERANAWDVRSKRDEPKCDRIHLWRDNSSHVLIGAGGMWRSDSRKRNVGARIGHSALWLLAFAREAIDRTGAGASSSLHSLLQIHRNMSPIMVEKYCESYNIWLIVKTVVYLSVKFKLTDRCKSYATTMSKNWFTGSPMTSCSDQESPGMVWGPFSASTRKHRKIVGVNVCKT